ncbi:MAG TPA: uroporphyrinogen-III synthase [Candidatus Nanopelagicaceae bacterium]|nr:uroporphyrinogen-III synthase [Candidatus Nanopelagicaceae bacterium]
MSKPVLLIRGAGNDVDALALSKLGLTSLIDPYLDIEVSAETRDAFELLDFLVAQHGLTWLIATSVNALKFWIEIIGHDRLVEAISAHPELHFAAIGKATAKALSELGAHPVLTPEEATSAALSATLQDFPPGTAIIPSGNLAMTNLPRDLEEVGWTVRSGIVYTTAPKVGEPESASMVRRSEVAAILLRSPSAVRAFLTHVPSLQIPKEVVIVCAGPTSAKAATEFGIRVDAVATDPTPESVAVTIHSLLARRNHGNH